jgi:hypothetical protein
MHSPCRKQRASGSSARLPALHLLAIAAWLNSIWQPTSNRAHKSVDSLTIAGIVFVCTFGGARFGLYLRRVLPEPHLSTDSKDVVKMGTGLIATLSALVLGLLIASAKNSFDAQRNGLQQLSTNLILLDRSLKFYGPETKEIRDQLRSTVTVILDHRWPTNGTQATGLDAPEISESGGALFAAIRDLSPRTDSQKAIQSQALQVSFELARTRWLMSQGDESSIPIPFLIVLVSWLTVLFITFGLFSPPNATVITILFICAVSVAGALFLIVELDRPMNGLIQISSKPLRDALGQLGL